MMGALLLLGMGLAAGYCLAKFEPVVKAVLAQVIKK